MCVACGLAPSTACATGFCGRITKLANLPQAFQILDTQDQLSAVKRLVQAIQHRRRALSAQATAVVHRRLQGRRAAPARMSHVRDAETRRKVEIYQLYEDQCQREGVVDFGELMLRSYELLRDNDAAARALPAPLQPHPD
jgi:DNA helicase-2/ATP-dependent DNA helicase PcrA